MSSGANESLPGHLYWRVADDLDFLERRLPPRAAARTSRQALADYYGTSPEGAMTSWRQPLGPVPDVESPTRRAILSGRGGVGGGEPPQTTDSGDSMSSSDDEEGSSSFKPGQDNPEDFFQGVRVKTAHRKRRGVTPCASLLGLMLSSILDAFVHPWCFSFKWIIMDAFVLSYPMEDVENQATEKLLEMTQKTRLKPYKTEVYDQLVKMEMMTAANDAEAHKIKVKDNRFRIKVVLGGFQRTLDKRISKKFKNALQYTTLYSPSS